VRAGIRSSVDVDAVVAAARNDYHEGSAPTPDEARQWARLNVRTDSAELFTALGDLYAVGYTLGHDYAHTAVALAQRARRKAVAPDPYAIITDWDDWKPGLEAANNLVRPPGGLQRLLDRRNAIIAGLDATTVDRIGTVLADGLAVGASDIMIAANIEAITGDATRALSIATTEMCAAVSVATVDNYADLEVEQVEWFALEGCELCEENAEQGPILLGAEFPSGDTEPPAHTNCRCSLLPWIEDDSVAVRGSGDGSSNDDSEVSNSSAVSLPDDVEAPDTAGNMPEPEDLARGYSPAAYSEISDFSDTLATIRNELGDAADNYATVNDSFFKSIIEAQAFDGLPELVDTAADLGEGAFYRGISAVGGSTAAELAEGFRSGDFFLGKGLYGDGTYFSSKNAANAYAAMGESRGAVLAASLRSDAKVMRFRNTTELYKFSEELMEEAERLDVETGFGHLMAMKGYDAYRVGVYNPDVSADIETYTVVLNRTALRVARQ
jgi:hypothetical protein